MPVPCLMLALCLALSTGCLTNEPKLRPKQPALALSKQPAAVALVLDEPFQNYKDAKSRSGETFVLALGPALCDYATNVTRAVFDRVEVYEGAKRPDAGTSCVAVFLPKVSRSNQVLPFFGSQKREAFVVVEWTVTVPKSGEILWVGSVEGKAEEMAGSPFIGRDRFTRKLAQKLVEDLTTNTVRAFSESAELKKLGATPK